MSDSSEVHATASTVRSLQSTVHYPELEELKERVATLAAQVDAMNGSLAAIGARLTTVEAILDNPATGLAAAIQATTELIKAIDGR